MLELLKLFVLVVPIVVNAVAVEFYTRDKIGPVVYGAIAALLMYACYELGAAFKGR